LDAAFDLPNACTLNGRCQEVCPMRIPLPSLLRRLRQRQFEARFTPRSQRLMLAAWSYAAARPRLYRLLTGAAGRVLGRLGRRKGRFSWLPLARGWTQGRDFPAPQGETFMGQWAKARRNAP